MEKAIEMGMEVIIGGNFNDEHKPNTRMTKTLISLSLVNITSPQGQKSTPPTYIGGKINLDHIWVSKDILADITDSGYFQYYLIINSYRRGILLNIYEEDRE